VISVNQDPLGNQAECLWEQEGLQVWGKQLADGSYAAGIFNHGNGSVDVVVSDVLAKAGWMNVGPCRDIWRQMDCPESVRVQSHGVVMVKFNANK
jgi:alpha-galactosidase